MVDPKFQRHGITPAAAAAPRPTSPAARSTAPAPGGPRAGTQPAKPARPQTAAPGPAAADPNVPGKSASGRVIHDARGNAVWDWVTTTTKNALLSATNLLKKLDSTELSLEEPADEKAAMLPKHRPGGGFNPYEQANKPHGKK